MKTLSLLAAPIFLAATAFAQTDLPEHQKPHESLAPFEAAVGHWEGQGTYSNEMNEGRMPWTCTADIQPILGGFAYQENQDVDMGEGMGHYHMMAIYTYDAAKGQLVYVKTDNMNGTSDGICAWVDGALVCAGAAMFPTPTGSTMIGAERSVWAIDGDTSELSITMLMGKAPASVHVDGTMTRTNRKASVVNASMRSETLVDAMKPFEPMLGKWHMKGSWVMKPGAERMEIAGDDVIEIFSGGHAIVGSVLGVEMNGFQYKAVGTMSWNDSKKCWDNYHVDNMGGFVHSEWFEINKGTFVTMHSGQSLGEPYAERGIFKLGKDGPISVTSDRYAGEAPGFRTFEGTYAKGR